jgi:hypothetical protein
MLLAYQATTKKPFQIQINVRASYVALRDIFTSCWEPKYTCIDINGMHDAVPPDLNTPLSDESFLGRYDMVADHCSNSHVFNVGEGYRTIHRLCKPGPG